LNRLRWQWWWLQFRLKARPVFGWMGHGQEDGFREMWEDGLTPDDALAEEIYSADWEPL